MVNVITIIKQHLFLEDGLRNFKDRINIIVIVKSIKLPFYGV